MKCDAWAAQSIEGDMKYFFEVHKFKDTDKLSSFDDAAENGYMLESGYMSITDINGRKFVYPTKVYFPRWQIGLIYAADHPGKYGLTSSNSERAGCVGASGAYNYMNGTYSTFNDEDFLHRIKDISVYLRFNDGYNIAEVDGTGGTVSPTNYGVRPSTSAVRTAVITSTVKFERDKY